MKKKKFVRYEKKKKLYFLDTIINRYIFINFNIKVSFLKHDVFMI